MPPKQTALQSRVRTLEYTTESNMEKGKPYLFTTENISLKELGAQGWMTWRKCMPIAIISGQAVVLSTESSTI